MSWGGVPPQTSWAQGKSRCVRQQKTNVVEVHSTYLVTLEVQPSTSPASQSTALTSCSLGPSPQPRPGLVSPAKARQVTDIYRLGVSKVSPAGGILSPSRLSACLGLRTHLSQSSPRGHKVPLEGASSGQKGQKAQKVAPASISKTSSTELWEDSTSFRAPPAPAGSQRGPRVML